MSTRFRKLIGFIFWVGSGLFASLIACGSAIALYFFLLPPFQSSQFPSDPYIIHSQSMSLGPITLEDSQILIVFGILLITSIALAIYAFRQFYLQFDNTEKSAK